MSNEWTEDYIKKEFSALGLSDWHVVVHSDIASTMDEARTIISNGIVKPACIVARQQHGGRGQQGRVWRSLPGGFYCTYVLPLNAGVSAAGFSLVTGVVISQLLAEFDADTRLKWPNDILDLEGKKLAGILTEVVPVINGQALLIGIGINFYNQVDPQIATSLELLGVKGLKIHQAAALLADNLQISLKSFIQDGFSAFLKTWNERDYLLGRRIRIAVSNEEIVGSVFGVSQQGALLLQSGDLIREIWSGHITEIYPEIFKD